MRSLNERQINGGVRMLVPCGTTGESATMTEEEDERVIGLTIEVAQNRAKVIAGAGSNSTAAAIECSKRARDLGADAVLQVATYYKKPTQEGIVSVASNEVPDLMSKMTDLALDGNWDEARELHYRLLPLMEVNFIESSPGPLKAAMAMMGLLDEKFRLPLVPIQENSRKRIR